MLHHSFFRNLPPLLICMTVNFPHHIPEVDGWSCLKTTLGDGLTYLSEKRTLASLVVLLQLYEYFRFSYRYWKSARSLRLIQLTETRLTQLKKWWWLEVASNGEHSWVSTKVLSKRLILFNMSYKETNRSRAYGFTLDGFKLVCPLMCYAADHRGFLQEAKSYYFKGYT